MPRLVLTTTMRATTIRIIMADAGTALPLFVWLSPAFPVGSFAFSHGIEWAVEAGDIHDAQSLETWLDDLLRHGAVRADAVLLAATWRTPHEAEEINALALALSPSSERHLETAAQGTAFLRAVAAAWPAPNLTRLRDMVSDRDIAYPVALGFAAATHRIAVRTTLEAFVLAAIGNLTSAALRLGPVGQSDVQAILARSMTNVTDLAAWAETSTLEDLGTAAWRSDIASMRHETQYSRLFRS